MATYIGVDIGSRFVKVVQLEHTTKVVVSNAFMFPVPLARKNPPQLNAQEFIKELTKHIPLGVLRNSSVAVNIPSSLVNALVVVLPKIKNRRELTIAVNAEAKRKMVPTPGPESVFEHSVVGEVIENKIPRYEVVVIKTERAYIHDTLELFSRMEGIHPKIITPISCTVINTSLPDSEAFQKDTAFVDLGYTSLAITITKKGQMCFFRNVKFGLKDVISRISSSLSLTLEEVEKIIKEKGVPEVDIDLADKVKVAEEIMRQKYEASLQEGVEEEVNPLELRMLWAAEIERIIHEVRRTLIFYKDQSQGRRVEHLSFLGGGAQIKGLLPELVSQLGGGFHKDIISEQLGIHLDRDISSYVRENHFLFSPALSLAMTVLNLMKTKDRVNFLPLYLKKKETIVHRQVAAIVCGMCLVAALFLGWLKFEISTNVLRKTSNNLDFEMQRIRRVLEKIEQFEDEKRMIAEKYERAGEIISSRIDVVPALRVISDLIPSEVVLSSLTFQKRVNKGFIEVESRASRRRIEEVEGIEEVEEKESSGQITPEEYFALNIEALCADDYENTLSRALWFKERIEKSGIFREVKVILPVLEKVNPALKSEQRVVLTHVVNREFFINAELIQEGEQESSDKESEEGFVENADEALIEPPDEEF